MKAAERKFKLPRLFVADITLNSGRFVSIMLGVAFTHLDAVRIRQRFNYTYGWQVYCGEIRAKLTWVSLKEGV